MCCESISMTIKTSNATTAGLALERIKDLLTCGAAFDAEKAVQFIGDIQVKECGLFIEESYSFNSWEVGDLFKEIALALAEKADSPFEIHGDLTSFNCPFKFIFMASYNNRCLKIKAISSENGDAYCQECFVPVCFLENYDPNETYYCPECGEKMDHLEMFEGRLPKITEETITF